jgi:hypothetical protein
MELLLVEQFAVLVADMLLDKVERLEQLVARPAAELALVLVLDVIFRKLVKHSEKVGKYLVPSIKRFMKRDTIGVADLLFYTLTTVVARIDVVPIDQKRNLIIQVLQPSSFYFRIPNPSLSQHIQKKALKNQANHSF